MKILQREPLLSFRSFLDYTAKYKKKQTISAINVHIQVV
ncbi:hypothetical protein KNP414_01996 [Paenibacillus mucilaginosus KNP414]|uniref:Uncharacterized protein n=1 Tax=Paenibacillus mucilaginosus (strain KNP414) TaxID=1036673 RepID=F8FRK0_PAEMK|nr:hypothetical protein KNP414_01996 [Paenibacillus mucilaginosus KNP414]